eukprot:Skav221193  [mRNA]  locus=scaffold3557:101113:110462:+ [translate_table: standard]
MGSAVPGGQLVRVTGHFPAESESFHTITLVDVEVTDLSPVISCKVTDPRQVLLHQQIHRDHLQNVYELCSGASLTSFGFAQAGFKHMCSVEVQPKLADLHRTLHPNVPVINASVLDASVVCEIWRHMDQPGTAMIGFACQPYSRGGNQGGASDERAASLPGSLTCAYLLQSPVIVLENVTQARTNEQVRKFIDALHHELGFHIQDCALKLEDMWASNRYRWWVVASHPCIGPVHLPTPAGKCQLVVRDLMPFVRSWPAADEQQLELTEAEMERFQIGGAPMRQYTIKPDSKLPTALHSWGNQVQRCACDCRPGFSDDLLRTRGIYAQLLPLPPSPEGRARYRHPHVLELSVLNGVPTNVTWSEDQRLNLCALGQMAAPMHSLWIASCIRKHLDLLFQQTPVWDPEVQLTEFKQLLWTQARQLYPEVPRPVPSPAPVQLVDLLLQTPAGFKDLIKVPASGTIEQLLQAEATLAMLDGPVIAQDVTTLQPVPSQAALSDFAELKLVLQPGPSAMPVPDEHADNHGDEDDAAMDAVEHEEPEEVVEDSSTSEAADAAPVVSTQMVTVGPAEVAVSGQPDTPMTRLSQSQLLALLPPVVHDSKLCEAMRAQDMPGAERLMVLGNQDFAWGDDEVWFHLRQIAQVQDPGLVVVDPLLMIGWAQSGSVEVVKEFLAKFPHMTRIVSVVLFRGHWTPYCWTPKGNQLLVRSWDHCDADINPLNHLHSLLCHALGLDSVAVTCERRQFGSDMCGAAAIAFVDQQVLSIPLPNTEHALFQAHMAKRQVFARACQQNRFSKPWCWGKGTQDIPQTLATLLQFHGVPAANAPNRAKLVLQSLGKEEVGKVLSGVAPWKSLKQLTNQHKPVIQLVMPDELQKVVAARQAKPKTAASKKRQLPTVPLQPADLDPTKLELLEGAFCKGNQVIVSQIAATQVGPLATGVALVTMQEAKPFLQSSQLLTQDGLALLILNPPDEIGGSLLTKKIRFAARCTLNMEPMLLTGLLVQLGGTVIAQHCEANCSEVSADVVACARFTVFRDQWPYDWEAFAAKPVKAILDVLEPLQQCMEPNCDCPKVHPDPMNKGDVVRDVFRRQFFTDSGRPTKALQSTHFSVFMRYDKQQELAVLHCSGSNGLYVEPRVESGAAPADEFQIVWLPQSGFSDVQYKAQCEPHSIGITRTGQRYGIRVLSKNYQSVYQSLKPGGMYLQPGVRMTFHSGPWPFGADRKQIAKVIKEQKWSARPLQPIKTVEGGLMWAIQAVDAPDQTVWTLKHGQVVVTKAESTDGTAIASQGVIGQSSTVKMCTSNTASDPWLQRDPWQSAPRPAMAPPVQDKLQDLEARIEKAILAKLPSERMETDDHDSRLQLLEQQMSQVSSRQIHLEQVVGDHHMQHTAQVQSLQSQMTAQLDVQRHHMAEMFKEQMSHIENLLHKPRCRVGEAKTPGPKKPVDWSIAVCNPSGVLGKTASLASLEVELLAISETHLTSTSKKMFQSSLQANSNHRFVATGHPMQARYVDQVAGQWSGVATTASVPCRPLCANWPPDLYETGRVLLTGAFVGDVWITGGLVYGYPQSKCHKNPLQRTSAMLSFLAEHLLTVATGPRYFCGDWNHDIDAFEVTELHTRCGWKEVQVLQHQLHGTPIQHTCKGKTRKDFLWLSQELQACFVSCEVLHEVFSDHSVLKTSFRMDTSHIRRFVWPTPQQVPWNLVSKQPETTEFPPGTDPTVQYQLLWERQETCAAAELGVQWKSSMAGRGHQSKPRMVQGWVPPPRKGRSGDPQPDFFGYHIQHSRWIKQLRRLDNYVRWAEHHWSLEPSSQHDHGHRLWTSILTATGFSPSFADWWKGREFHGLGDVASLPVLMPNHAIAAKMLEMFTCEVRWFEQLLRGNKRIFQQHKHQVNPNLIYRDVKRPTPEPVTSLLHRATTKVVEIDPDDVALLVDPPQQFDPEVVQATPDKLFVEDVTSAREFDTVEQTRPMGKLQDIFEAFHIQWRRRWCRHDGLPSSHWREIVEFSVATLPRHECVLPSMTPDLLRAEVSHKKPRTACGLDGVSRHDLLSVPPSTLQSLINMFGLAQSTGQWPKQVTAGKVASLAKRVDAEGCNDFRPITVFSLSYRCFSSIHARALLRWASTWCDMDIHGNRQHHQTAHLWNTIVQNIQLAYDQQATLTGLTADIEKAFNCLPRWPVLSGALAAGTPYPLVVAWAGALQQMVRHFKVRESYSDGFESSTGLAKGCALSCYGMLILDHLCHRWIHAQQPAIRMLSFVDNWDLLTWQPHLATAQLDLLLEFCRKADLTVDLKKTYGWSTSPVVRASMRKHGIPVKHHAKDLGAHIAMTRQLTNASQVQRIRDMDSFWGCLQRSRAGYHAKVRVLRTVAWPRSLHAVSNTSLGNNHWLSLRRQAVKALNMQKPGVNPALVLGMLETHLDPQLYAIMHTFRDHRQFRASDFWASEVYPAAVGDLDPIPTSPVAITLHCVQELGFTVLPSGELQDAFGPFHPSLINFHELELRVQFAWHRVVAEQVSHRQDLVHMDAVDTATTRAAVFALPSDQQTLIRLSLCGGLFTQDAHQHWNDTDGVCQWCGAQDSLRHRYYDCPQTADMRNSLAPQVLKHFDHLPSFLTLRGWAWQPPTTQAWRHMLLSLPAEVPPLYRSFVSSGWNHVFTDGSCYNQHLPSQRFAAWGAVLACPCDSGWDFQVAGVLGAAGLSGLCQTAYRAELYAVGYALHHAAIHGARIALYCDCQGVVNRVLLLLHGACRVHCNKANSDLWRWISASVERLGASHIRIRKIKAHRQLAQASTRQELWEIWNNGAADRVAKTVNLQRTPEFWALWRDHSATSTLAAQLHAEVMDLHCAVAKFSVNFSSNQTLDDAPVPVEKEKRTFDMEFSRNGWDGSLPAALLMEYGSGLMQKVCQWWLYRTNQVQEVQLEDVQWVTFAHLYVDFQLTWGHAGPLKHHRQWLDQDTRPYLEVEKFSFTARLKWFRRCLKVFWKQTNQRISLATCKGTGEAIQSYVACASVHWDATGLRRSDQWLLQMLKRPCLKGTKPLVHLPVAKRCSQMSLQAFSPGD